jgi:hypothetical protein
MKLITGILFLLTSLAARADAGFPISREKAGCTVTFTGTALFKGYRLYDMENYRFNSQRDSLFYKNPEGSVNDETWLYWQDGKRNWSNYDGIFHLKLIDTLTGKVTDSLEFMLREHSRHFTFLAVQDGKLQYKVDSTREIYDYNVFGSGTNSSTAKRNRNIFIGVSIAGFIALLLLFIFNKRKKEQINN